MLQGRGIRAGIGGRCEGSRQRLRFTKEEKKRRREAEENNS